MTVAINPNAIKPTLGRADNVWFLQGGTGAMPRTSQDKQREVQINIKDYGAACDGVTDDYAYIVNALTWAQTLGGGVVDIPVGTVMTGTQILVPSTVRIRGTGKRTSAIKATASFPNTDAVIRLGTTSAFAFDCRLEDLAINCNDVAPIGIVGTCIQEGSGARNVLVTRYTTTGVDLDESAGSQYCDHYQFDDMELSCSSAATTSRGFHYKGLKNGGQIRRMTVNPNLPAGTQNYGVHIEGTGAGGCHVQIIGLNVESHQDAVFVDANAGATIIGASLITGGTNVVRMNTTMGVECTHIHRIAGTNAINDVSLGITITDVRVPSYVHVPSAGGSQAFSTPGRSVNDGCVTSADNPVHTVKTTATSTGAQRCAYRLLDGNNDGWLIQFAGDGTNDPLRFIPITTGTAGNSVFDLRDNGAIRSLVSTNGPVGTFTLGASATTLVGNTAVSGSSIVQVFPTNAAAATLMSGSKSLYISAQVANSSFSVATADATAAAGTETFNYIVLN